MSEVIPKRGAVPTVHVELPSQTRTIRLAAIGFGSRISHICRMLCKLDPNIRVAAAMDTDTQRSRQWAAEREIPHA